MTAGLLAAQPGGWTGAPSGAAVPDAWLLPSDAAFAGLLPGYAFAQSVTQTLSLTAADSITDTAALELEGAQGIATFTSGGSIYVAVAATDNDGVQILDVTDPSAITAEGNITDTEGANELLLNGAWDIAVFESGGSTYAAVASFVDNGVQILNVTDPSAITAEGNIADTTTLALDRVRGIATFTSGGSTYAAVASSTENGVQILDVTDPSAITAAGNITDTPALELDGAWGIAVFESGGGTYAAVTANSDDGVQILNVTDPSAITAAGNITDTPALELDGAWGIAVFESGGSTYAAVAADSDDGVQILDVTDPSAITAEGNITDTGALELKGARGIATFESGGSTYAAVASSVDSGVQILDVTDPSAVTAAGSIADTASLVLSEAESIATFTSGGSTYAAVAAYDDSGVQILRLTAPPPDAFVTTWETTGANQAITIPATGTYSIDWGDGTVNATASGTQTHNYTSAGNHTVAITGGLESVNINSLPSQAEKDKLRSIDQWGNITWTTMADAFHGASNMAYDAADTPDLSGVDSMIYMFHEAHSFNGNLSGWDVSSVTDMEGMFRSARSFNGNLSGWDVSSVTDMKFMFYDAHSFNVSLSGWDVSSVTSMISLFFGADSFNGNISGWNVSQVTDMRGMFYDADSFNQPLSGWDVSSVTGMRGMFYDADSFNQPLNDWNVSQVTDMRGMFYDADSFNQPISDWNVSQVTHMEDMFHGATAFNQDISTWDVSSVRFMNDMFTDAAAFDQNLGEWYVVLNSTEIDADDAPGVVGTISAQNQFLRGQSVTYGIGAGGDSGSFNITGGSNLNMNISSPAKSLYTVNITSAGGFGDNNHRVYNVTVTGFDTNSSPTVNAGPDQTVDEGATVTLSGTATDVDTGDALTYSWTHDSSLTITFANPAALSTSFTAPDVAADTTITVTLTVNDGTVNVSDTLQVTITDSSSIPPAVDAGPGLTAADSITDTGTLKLFNARGIATFESAGRTYAAVTGYLDYGVQILDVTNPYGITAAGSIADDAALELAGAWDVATFTSGGGTYAAVTAYFGDGVQILNVTDPSDITATDSIGDTETRELSGAFGIATFTSGSRTYAAVTALWDDDGVQILDVTDPSDITAAGSIGDTRTLELSGASDVATFTSGGRTYAAVAAYWDDGVQILDITNPSSVTAAGSIGDTAALELDGAHDIATFTSGGRAYAAVAAYWDDGVQILDVTDPSAITAAGSITDDAALELDGAEGITVFESGGRTYAAVASVVDDGVQMLDITDPSDITAVGSITDDAALELLGASGIATFTSGGDTYAAVTAHFDSGVQILRLTGGGAILTASSQFVGEPDNAQGFAESGTVIPRLAIRDLSVQVAPDSPPTVTSIARSDPAGAATSERTLVFAVTFSEDVTGVDLGDFALSPDSTGGGSAPGQFTQTSEPATRIADRSTIQDAITVDRSGTATSVSVAVDISHTYRGDLVIDSHRPRRHVPDAAQPHRRLRKRHRPDVRAGL